MWVSYYVRSVHANSTTITHSQTEQSEWMSRKRLAAVTAVIFAIVLGKAGALSMLVISAARNTFPSHRAALLRVALQQQSHYCCSSSSRHYSSGSTCRPSLRQPLRSEHPTTRTGGELALAMSTASTSAAASVDGTMRFGRMQVGISYVNLTLQRALIPIQLRINRHLCIIA